MSWGKTLLAGMIAGSLGWLSINGAAEAQSAETTADIVYLSRTTAYIDKGEADGLMLNAELEVYRGERSVGLIQVDYLAQHSASCRIVSSTSPLEVGDTVYFTPIQKPVAPVTEEPEPDLEDRLSEPPPPIPPLMLPPVEDHPRFHGRVALEWEHFSDAEDTDDDFQQPSMYLRLNGHRISNRPLHFQMRLRSKYTERSRALNAESPEDEWLHRLYLLSLSYSNPEQPIRLELGRLYARDLRGAGNWDGGLIELRPTEHWRLGFLAGGAPDLTDSEVDFNERQFGGYVTHVQDPPGPRRYRGTIGFVGQYQDGDVSREFISLANELALGTKLHIYQNMELDLNRDWREDVSGESQTLSRLNAHVRYRFSRTLSFDVAYDHYQNVRRVENREIPDSLFADAALQGLRAGARIRLSSSMRLGGRIGYRDRDNEDKRPVFANADFGWSDLLGTGADLQLHYAYADGRYAESHVPSLDLQRYFGRKLRLGLGLGSQSYDGIGPETLTVEGQWFRFFGTYLLRRHLDLQWLYTQTEGDIAAGSRVLLRLGYHW